MTFTAVLKRLGPADITTHGFDLRSVIGLVKQELILVK